MMHIFVNGLSASAGGGLTYLRNVLPHLAGRGDVRVTAALAVPLRHEFSGLNQQLLETNFPPGTAQRFLYEQCQIPRLIRQSKANVLLSPGNFAIFRSPVPQIVLSRNALYTSRDFANDLRDRGEYRLWLDNAVKSAFARRSVGVADCTIAPTAAFARELHLWTGKDVTAIHHGFDHDLFFRDQTPLPPEIESKLAGAASSLRLLFVSHYNYYRNFETLIRAIPLLKKKLYPRTVRLILTCSLTSESNPGDYRAESAAALVENLRLRDEIIELGSTPYRSLHHLYRACDLYVTPAYAETFAHPLVEAMASGLPVIASDIAVHREICGGAALYFSRFSPQELAESVLHAARSHDQIAAMRTTGLSRARDFSWNQHVEQLLETMRRLTKNLTA